MASEEDAFESHLDDHFEEEYNGNEDVQGESDPSQQGNLDESNRSVHAYRYYIQLARCVHKR